MTGAMHQVYHEEGVATTIAELATSVEGNRGGASGTPGYSCVHQRFFAKQSKTTTIVVKYR
jgi:hypothetical protein